MSSGTRTFCFQVRPAPLRSATLLLSPSVSRGGLAPIIPRGSSPAAGERRNRPPRARKPCGTPLQCASPRRTVDPGRRPAGPPAVLKAACRDPAVRCAGCPACPRPPSGTRLPGGPSQPSPCGAPARAPRPDVFRPRPPRCKAQFRLRPGPPLPEFPAPDAPVARLPVPSLPTLAVGMRQDPRHPRDRAPPVGLRAARGSGARSACLRRDPPGCPPPGTATPPRPAAARPPEAPASGLPSRRAAPSACRTGPWRHAATELPPAGTAAGLPALPPPPR